MPYHLPTTLQHALEYAGASNGDFAYVAGGTDQMVQRSQGNNSSKHVIDLTRIATLRGVEIGDVVRIGACTTLAAIGRDVELKKRFPALVESARAVASPLIRASATIGGNLLCENRCVFFDQSEFWREAVGYCLKCGGDVCIATSGSKNCFSVCISDIAPALICLDAEVEFIDASGVHRVAIDKLYTGDGTLPRALPSEAIITAIVIPHDESGTMIFRKLRSRASVDFTNLTMAMRTTESEIIVALTGVASKPVSVRAPRATDAESITAQLLRAATIIDNLPYPRMYRKEMVGVFVGEGMGEHRT